MQAPTPASRQRRPVLWSLLGLTLIAIGLLLAQPFSPEGRFALKMILPHAQAVEPARILERRTADENLRYFTLDVAQTQQAQMAQVRGGLPW